MIVPFCDLAAQNRELMPELTEAFERVALGNRLILGPELAAFESEWAAFCGAKYAVGVGNGLEALTLILRAYGIGQGDEVIVPVHTCIATWMAVSQVGATLVPVDCLRSGAMDLQRVMAVMSERTSAIVPVHLYGRENRLFQLMDLGPKIVVDAAQGHGLKAIGNAAGFSFYPTKNLGALGDGGAVVTDDEELADRVRLLRNYGSSTKNEHQMASGNSRLDELQAAFLRVKLRRLISDNETRRRNANIYFDILLDCPGVVLPTEGIDHVWHQFVIMVKDQYKLYWNLADKGIGTAVHYPTPPHLQPAYKYLGFKAGDFPVAEQIATECLSLPIGPEHDERSIRYVAEHVRMYVG